jgi:hypothetical protein
MDAYKEVMKQNKMNSKRQIIFAFKTLQLQKQLRY